MSFLLRGVIEVFIQTRIGWATYSSNPKWTSIELAGKTQGQQGWPLNRERDYIFLIC
jgi:hypothetical protein